MDGGRRAVQVARHGPLKIGLAYLRQRPLRRANFDWFRVVSADPCVPPPTRARRPAPEAGFSRIWDGTHLNGWRQAGPGAFELVNDGAAEGCRLDSRGGLGMLWYELASTTSSSCGCS